MRVEGTSKEDQKEVEVAAGEAEAAGAVGAIVLEARIAETSMEERE